MARNVLTFCLGGAVLLLATGCPPKDNTAKGSGDESKKPRVEEKYGVTSDSGL